MSLNRQPTRCIRVDRAAVYLDTSTKFVRDLVRRGTVRGYRIARSNWVINLEDLERYLREIQIDATEGDK